MISRLKRLISAFTLALLVNCAVELATGNAARYGTERFAAAVVIGPDGEVFAPTKATSLPLGAIADAGNDPGFISSWVYDEAEKQLPSGDASIQQMLHMGALLYWTASNAGEEIACRTNGTWCQRLPSASWFASIPQTCYFFGIPRSSSFVTVRLNNLLPTPPSQHGFDSRAPKPG